MFEKNATVKPSKELLAALAAAEAAIEKRRRIEQSIQDAVALQPGAEARLQECLERYGLEQADAILAGTSSESSAHLDLTMARDSVDALAARIVGLRRRLVEQEAEVVAAEAAIVPLREQYTQQCLAQARAVLSKASEAFVAAIESAVGMGEALGVQVCDFSGVRFFEPKLGAMANVFDFAAENGSLKIRRQANDALGFMTSVTYPLKLVLAEIEQVQRDRTAAAAPQIPAGRGSIAFGEYVGRTREEWEAAQDDLRHRKPVTFEIHETRVS